MKLKKWKDFKFFQTRFLNLLLSSSKKISLLSCVVWGRVSTMQSLYKQSIALYNTTKNYILYFVKNLKF